MAFSPDDLRYLDAKFGTVYAKLDDLRNDQTQTAADLTNHTRDSAICPKVISHERERHDAARTWTILGTIIGVFVGLFEVAKYLIFRR